MNRANSLLMNAVDTPKLSAIDCSVHLVITPHALRHRL